MWNPTRSEKLNSSHANISIPGGTPISTHTRNGICLLYREWNRPLKTLSSQQDHKLMFGLFFSLKSLTAKMDPTSVEKGNLGVPRLPGQGCSFHIFKTNTYKLSFMESPSGIKGNPALSFCGVPAVG